MKYHHFFLEQIISHECNCVTEPYDFIFQIHRDNQKNLWSLTNTRVFSRPSILWHSSQTENPNPPYCCSPRTTKSSNYSAISFVGSPQGEWIQSDFRCLSCSFCPNLPNAVLKLQNLLHACAISSFIQKILTFVYNFCS